MKYIGNAFSPAMIKKTEGDVIISIKTISKQQFMKAKNHAKSIIGHPELAEYFDLTLNRESISLKRGDMLYIALPSKRYKEGKIIMYGGSEQFNVQNADFTFKLIQVLEKKNENINIIKIGENMKNKINTNKDIKYFKTDIEEFTIKNLEEYCENNNEDINHIILNALGILIGRYGYEFNLILNQLVNEKLADDMGEINKFKLMWMKKVML